MQLVWTVRRSGLFLDLFYQNLKRREREGLQTLDRCDGGGGTKQTWWNLKKNISIIFIIVTDYKARQTGHNHVTVLGNTDNIYIEINFRHCPAI